MTRELMIDEPVLLSERALSDDYSCSGQNLQI